MSGGRLIEACLAVEGGKQLYALRVEKHNHIQSQGGAVTLRKGSASLLNIISNTHKENKITFNIKTFSKCFHQFYNFRRHFISLIDDIVFAYHRYCKSKMNEKSDLQCTHEVHITLKYFILI